MRLSATRLSATRHSSARSLEQQIAAIYRDTEGVWYDPSDITRYMATGPELVVNGDFSDGLTGWSAFRGASISHVNGRLRVTEGVAGQSGVASKPLTTVVGKWYKISVDVPLKTVSNAIVRIMSGYDATVDTYYVDAVTISGQKFEASWKSVSTDVYIGLQINGVDSVIGSYVEFDNISVKELPLISTATMFQDAAGTIPVTGVEQPIGLILDKSWNGNNASQTVSTKRPTLSARYNLLTKTEYFSDAVWGKAGAASVTEANTINLPAVNDLITQTISLGGAPVGTKATFSAEMSGTGTIDIVVARSGTGGYEDARLRITLTAIPTRYSVSHTIVNASQMGFIAGIARYSGATATTVTATNAQLETGTTFATRYQRVNTSTDYDTVGFPMRLAFDGVDDSLSTPSIDFTSTDKMTVCAGVRKLSDAASGVVAELSLNSDTNVGTFRFDQDVASPTYRMQVGSSFANRKLYSVGKAAPSADVLLGAMALTSGGSLAVRLNGTLPTQTKIVDVALTAPTFSNNPLHIGARAGTSLFFNGHLNQLTIFGKTLTPSQLAVVERYTGRKTGITL